MSGHGKAPDQVLYDVLFDTSQRLGYATYTHNPPADAGYPFVHINKIHLIPRSTKTQLLACGIATFDVWGSYIDRQRISTIAHSIISAASRWRFEPGSLRWKMVINHSTTEVLPDNSAGEPLWRARANLEFILC